MNYEFGISGLLLKAYKQEEIANYIRLSLAGEVKASGEIKSIDGSKSVNYQRRLMNEFVA